MDPDTAAAVAQVSQGASGTLRVRMHDKTAALEKLARALGMFRDHVEIDGTKVRTRAPRTFEIDRAIRGVTPALSACRRPLHRRLSESEKPTV